MSADDKPVEMVGPDLKSGVEYQSLQENSPLLGHFDGEAVIVVRKGDQVFATGATCSHYSGPLAEGLVVGDSIHCPWHHARFSLRSGEAIGAPALNAIPCFTVRREADKVKIERKCEADFRVSHPREPSAVVIIGDGAAGAACADMLRTKGYSGPVTIVGSDEPVPVDRPNLSKDYLAGTAPEEWIPLRTQEYYESARIELITANRAARIDPAAHTVTLQDGRLLPYGAALLATGSEARSLPIEGANLAHVFRLRTHADSRAIAAQAGRAKRAVVIGSSFIALEVAASLRHRGLEVAVVGPETVPLAKVLGSEVGRFVQDLHEQNGVRFFLGVKPAAIREDKVELSDGRSIPAEVVVLGVGVSPRVELAKSAGLDVEDGVIVDETLRTSAPDVYAAGDVARYPDAISGEKLRIEHWVVAERQGQAVARAMLGIGGGYRDAPFFWSQHYDVAINYVGHPSSWDAVEVHGDLKSRDACVVYRRGGRAAAVATIGQDRVSLEVEAALERGDRPALESILEKQ